MSSPSSTRIELPIDRLLPDIVTAVRDNPITLLEAEPGAGKTTRVPPALLEAGLQNIYVLEPRRLAAQLAARRVAEERNEPIGQTIGYQVRFEEVTGPQTRLRFVTEGILTQKLLRGSRLDGTEVVILDEFHERHIETDLAFALLRRLRNELGPDLRLLLMSATLGAEEIEAKLGKVAVLRSPGRQFPIELRHSPYSAAPLGEQVAAALNQSMQQTTGHVLIFLPGAAEIRQSMQACEGIAKRTGALLLPLHSALSSEEQDQAVRPSKQRKIIFSTNVAESSVTIDGVTLVIDSGLARLASFSPWNGLPRLQVEKVSQASAIQRAGRAGRTAPGIAIRLYPAEDFHRRPAHTSPEIVRSELAQMTLSLKAIGFDFSDLEWLDAPPEQAVTQAQDVLIRLGALNQGGFVTEVGQKMAGLPLHPRLARFLLAADRLGARRAGCEIAAKLSTGRTTLDAFRGNRYASDIDALLEVAPNFLIRKFQQQLLSAIADLRQKQDPAHDSHALEKALLLGFPDRLTRRKGETLLLVNGGSARLDRASATHSDFLIALEIEERNDQSSPLVRIASAVEPDWLLEFFPEQVEAQDKLEWNREGERVEQVSSLRFGELAIEESRSRPTDIDAASAMLAEKALEAGLQRFADLEEMDQFLARVRFAAEYSDEITVDFEAVSKAVQQLTYGLVSFAELKNTAKDGGLLRLLEAQYPVAAIDAIAPSHIQLPSGRRARIVYQDHQAPSVSSRLQDFFGMRESPRIAQGKVPLVVHLLAPSQRPVQTTTDLAGFWKNLYPQLRRELGRRYPKHKWPTDPLLGRESKT